MFFNRIAVFLALVVGALSSQLPEFAQQYRQRLGGAIDELNHILERFDADAAQRGMDRSQGIGVLEANSDPFVRGRGEQMGEIETHRDRLERQLQAFDRSQPLGEIVALAENFDSNVAAGAWSDFKPAVPVTAGGFVSMLLGFVAGLSVIHLCAWPIRRFRRRRLAPGRRDHASPV